MVTRCAADSMAAPAIRACPDMCGAGQGWSTPITAAMCWPTHRRAARSGASIFTPSVSPRRTSGRKRRGAATACSSISGRAILNQPQLEQAFLKRGVVSAARWAQTLGAEITALNAAPDDRETYYRAVLAALERVLAENGAVTRAELDEREEQWERAYLRTPHGNPVELAAGMKPD